MRFAARFLMAFCVVVGLRAQAQVPWIGAVDPSWTNAGNWLTASVPASTDDVVFDANSVNRLATWLGTDFTIQTLRILNPTGAVSIASNRLSIGAGGIDLSNATVNLTIASGLQPLEPQNWSVAAPRSLTVSGALQGTNELVKRGAGSLVLGAANTGYAGGFVVEEGTVTVSTATSFGTQDVRLRGTADSTTGVRILTANALNLSNTFIVEGIGAGSNVVAALNSTGLDNSEGLRLRFDLRSRDLVVDGAVDRYTIAGGGIRGTGNVTIVDGRVTMGGMTNTWLGELRVTGGSTFQNNSDEVIPNTAPVLVNGILQFNTGLESIDALSGTGLVQNITSGTRILNVGVSGGSGTFEGRIRPSTGNLYFNKRGAGTQVIAGTLDNDSQRMQVFDGVLELAKTSSVSVHAAALEMQVSGGTLRMGGSGGDQIFDGSVLTIDAGQMDLNARNEAVNYLQSLTTNGTILNLAPDTLSVLTLNATNGTSTYFGRILSGGGAGTVQVVKAGASTQLFGGALNVDRLIISNGIVQLVGNAPTVSGEIVNLARLDIASRGLIDPPFITGTGAVHVAGPYGGLRITGTNSFTGPLILAGGFLQLGDCTTGGSVETPIQTASGTLVFARSDNLDWSSAITGAVNVLKLCDSTLTLSGTNTYTGGTRVEAGRVIVTGLLSTQRYVSVRTNADFVAGLSGVEIAPSGRLAIAGRVIDTFENGRMRVSHSGGSLTNRDLVVSLRGGTFDFRGGVPADSVFPLNDLTNQLAIWLRADAGVQLDGSGNVTNWLDGSPYARHMRVTGITPPYVPVFPELNNQPVVRCNGLNRFKTADITGPWPTRNSSIFIVARATNNFNVASYFIAMVTTTNETEPTTRYVIHFPWTDGNVFMGLPYGNWLNYQPGAAAMSQFGIWFMRNSGGGLGRPRGRMIVRNGVLERQDGTAPVYDTPTGRHLALAGFASNAGWQGDLAELMIFTNALSETEEEQVGFYLARKYGFQGVYEDQPAAQAPFDFADASIIVSNNSTFYGANATTVRVGSVAIAAGVTSLFQNTIVNVNWPDNAILPGTLGDPTQLYPSFSSYDMPITGPGSVLISNGIIRFVGNSLHTYSGGLYLGNYGRLVLAKTNGANNAIPTNTFLNATTWNPTAGSFHGGIELESDEQIPDQMVLNVGGGSHNGLWVNGHIETIGGFTGLNMVVENSRYGDTNGTAIGALVFSNDAPRTFHGWFRDNDGSGTNRLSLVKRGTGTLTMISSTDSHNWSGPTRIHAGEVVMNNAGNAINGSGSEYEYQVFPGATLTYGNHNHHGAWNGGLSAVHTIYEGGVMRNNGGWVNALSNLTLAGGSLQHVGGYDANQKAWSIRGTIRVLGSNVTSTISDLRTNNGYWGIGLGSNQSATNVLEVADGAAEVDLKVDAQFFDTFNNTGVWPESPLRKTGPGTVVFGRGQGFTGPLSVEGGRVILTNSPLSGELNLSNGVQVVMTGGKGLVGEYKLGFSSLTNFDNQAAWDRYWAGTNSTHLYNSREWGFYGPRDVFDFAGDGYNFQPPYNRSNGQIVFEARWRGKFVASVTGVYTFFVASDDGSMLWINGSNVVYNNYAQGVIERSNAVPVTLTAGEHDIAYHYHNSGGGYGLYSYLIPPGGVKQVMSNEFLRTGSGCGGLSGDVGTRLSISNYLFTVAQRYDRTFGGNIDGDAGLLKTSAGRLTLGGTNTYLGGTEVRGGSLRLASEGAWAGGSLLVEDGTFDVNGYSLISTNFDGARGTITNSSTTPVVITLNPGDANREIFLGNLGGEGDVGLTKSGTNLLWLAGNNRHNGPFNLSGVVRYDGRNSGTSVVTLAAGSTLCGTGNLNGAVMVPADGQIGAKTAFAPTGTLAMASLALSDGAVIGTFLNVTNPTLRITAADGFSTGGTSNRIDIVVASALLPGRYTLIDYEGTIGGGGFAALVLGSLPTGVTATLDHNIAATSVDLVITAVTSLRWTGAINNLWDTNTLNWVTPDGVVTNYADGMAVLFNDLGNNPAITVQAAGVNPAAITVSNLASVYSWGGGAIAGAGGIQKLGAGLLIISNANAFLDSVEISNGTIRVASSTALGGLVGGTFVRNGGALDLFGQSIGKERVHLAGQGVTNEGCYYNSAAYITGRGTNTPGWIKLLADATISGGATNGFEWGRDAGRALFDWNGFRLRKIGGGDIWMVQFSVTNAADTFIPFSGNRLGIDDVSNPLAFTNTFAIGDGATLMFVSDDSVRDDYAIPLFVTNGIIRAGGGSAQPNLMRTIQLDGATNWITGGGAGFITGSIIGTSRVARAEAGWWAISSTNSYTGGTLLNAGEFILGYGINNAPTNSGSLAGDIILNGGSFNYAHSIAQTVTNNITGLGGAGNGNLNSRVGLGLFFDTNAAVNITSQWLRVGTYNYGQAAFRAGGVVNAYGLLIADLGNTAGDANMNGGVVNLSGSAANYVFRIGSLVNTGSFRMSGGLLTVSNSQMSVGWDGTGTLFMQGGEIVARSLQLNANGNNGNGRLILEGGRITLGAGGVVTPGFPSTNFLGGTTLAALESWDWSGAQPGYLSGTNGSLAFDTSTNVVNVYGPLLGTGGLNKAGSGRLLLYGTNSFSGLFVISNGTVFGSGSLIAPVVVRSNATLGAFGATAVGTMNLTNHLTLDSGAILGGLINGTNVSLRIGGVITNNGVTSVRVYPAGPVTAGTYPLFDYSGTLPGVFTNGFQLLPLPAGVTGFLTNNTVDTRIDLVVSSVAPYGFKWMGAVDGNWDIGLTTNWVDAANLPTTYADAAAILFDDSAIGSTTVTVAQRVEPSAILFSNVTRAYQVRGAWPVLSASLLKQGAGSVTLLSTNTFASAVALREGTIEIGNGGVEGSLIAPTLTNDGHLIYNRADTISAVAIAGGTGRLTKTGSGLLLVTNNLLSEGQTVVAQGTLQLGNNTAEGGVRGAVITNLGILSLYRSSTYVFTQQVTGAGSLHLRNVALTGARIAQASNTTYSSSSFTDTSATITNFAWLTDGVNWAIHGGSTVTVGHIQLYNGGSVSINGGAFTVLGNTYWGRDSGCTITQTGGVFTLVGQNSRQGPDSGNGGGGYSQYYGGSGHYTFNLNGGTFVSQQGWLNEGSGSFGAWWSDQLNFGGGTFRAAANNISINGRLLFTGTGGNFKLDTAGRSVSILLPSYYPGYTAIGGAGGFEVLGGGTANVEYAATYTGPTIVNSGSLILRSLVSSSSVTVASGGALGGTGAVLRSVVNSGVVNPGMLTNNSGFGVGVLSAGTYLQETNGILRIDILGTNIAAQYDSLIVTNSASLNGTLDLVLQNGFIPTGGSVFTLIQGGAVSGTFQTVNLPMPVGLGYELTYAPTAVLLTVTGNMSVLSWLPTEQADWDLVRTNWFDGIATMMPFSQGATVIFDDAGAYSNIVTLTDVLQPLRISFRGTSNYVLRGSGYLSGSGTLTLTGTPTVVIATTNRFDGPTTILGGGTLQLGDGVEPGFIGSGSISNDGVLAINQPQNITLVGALTGTGRLIKSGSGTLRLQPVAGYTGGTLVNGGALELVNANAITRGLTIESGGTVLAGAIDSINSFNPITIQPGGLLRQTAGTYQIFNAGPLQMNGGVIDSIVTAAQFSAYGNYILRNSMTVGGTNMSIVRADFRLGDGATRSVTVNETGDDIDLFFQGYVAHFHGVTWGYMNKLGTGTVAFSNSTYTVQLGSITVSSGEARFINALGTGSLGNGGLINNAVARYEVTTGFVQTNTAAISGTGVFIKRGAGTAVMNASVSTGQTVVVEDGTLALIGTNRNLGVHFVSNGFLAVRSSMEGPVTVATGGALGGTGVVIGLVEQYGTINPGEGIGTLTISNNLTPQIGAITRFEIAGTNSHDRLIVSGAHGLDGTLEVVLTNGFVPASGDRFRIIENQSQFLFINQLSNNLPALDPGLGWSVEDIGPGEALELSVTGTPGSAVGIISGNVWKDVDGDGVVDNEDVTNGISGVTVVLSGESQTNNTVTGVDGSYQFTNLIAGSYTITQIDLDGYASTMDRDGTNDNVVVIQLTAGETVTNVWYLDRKLSAYEVWAQTITNEAQRGDLMDADGDGYLNLWEYSQGTDATNSASNVKVWMGRTNGVMYVRFSRATGAVDVVYVVESGVGVSNGVVWEGVATNSLGLGWEGESSITESGTGSVRTVIAEDIDPAAPRRTMRVRVERP